MSERTIGERLSVVEEQVVEMRKSQDTEDENIKELLDSVKELQAELARYKGFLGGIVFVFSCVAAFLKTWPYINTLFNK